MTNMTYAQALEVAIAIMENTEAYGTEAIEQNEAIGKLITLHRFCINRAKKAKKPTSASRPRQRRKMSR